MIAYKIQGFHLMVQVAAAQDDDVLAFPQPRLKRQQTPMQAHVGVDGAVAMEDVMFLP